MPTDNRQTPSDPDLSAVIAALAGSVRGDPGGLLALVRAAQEAKSTNTQDQDRIA